MSMPTSGGRVLTVVFNFRPIKSGKIYQKIVLLKMVGTLFTEYMCLYLDSDKVDTGKTDV